MGAVGGMRALWVFCKEEKEREKIVSKYKREEHRRVAWGVQTGSRRPQATHPASGLPLKRLYGCFRGRPPAGRRRGRHGGPR
jgi:hypothetical protein